MKMHNWVAIAVLVLIVWVTIIQIDVSDIYDYLSHETSTNTTNGIFTPKETGYYPINDVTSGQVFLISLKEVIPYANGYKLIFHIGNTSSAAYEGVSFNYRWGESMDSLSETETVKTTTKLLSGVWNKVTIIASPAKKSEIERIVLSIETGTGTMTLKEDWRK